MKFHSKFSAYRKKYFKIIFLSLLTYSSPLMAEDSFFPDGYVKQDGSAFPHNEQTPTPSISKSAPAPELAPPSESMEPVKEVIESGTKLSALGIIINGTNAAHVSGALGEYLRIVEHYKEIDSLFIVLVGDQKTSLEAASPALSQLEMNPDVIKELFLKTMLNPIVQDENEKQREKEVLDEISNTISKDESLGRRMKAISSLSLVDKVPDEFKITYSPGWILDTARGRIMVEGIIKLGTFINEKGEFVESMLKEEQKDEMEKIQ